MENKRKLGIFGGSFNPIHLGHINLIKCLIFDNKIDDCIICVTPANPLKDNTNLLPYNDRYNMAKILENELFKPILPLNNIIVSDIETTIPKPYSTYRTLQTLQDINNDKDIYLIIGADEWLIFNQWQNYGKILKNFNIIVVDRPNYSINNSTLPNNVELITYNLFDMNISSTEIRNNIKNEDFLKKWLDLSTIHYIKEHNLFNIND